MNEDVALLRQFAENHDESAFAELVRQKLNSVYSIALRRTGGDAALAQDVAQQVFVALARDARRVSRHPQLTGWLYLTTRYAAASAVRSECRRKQREQRAFAMQSLASNGPEDADWTQVAPVLESALDDLNDADRLAILLRFMEGRSFTDIGTTLQLGEDAARKRVNRALDRLHAALHRRGIVSTATALGAALTHNAVSAAPSGLASTVTGAALNGIAFTTGTLAIMGLTKLQIAVVTLVAGGGAIGLVSQQHTIRTLQASDANLKAQFATLSTENAALAKARNAAVDEAAALRAQIAASELPRPVVGTANSPATPRTTSDSTVATVNVLGSPPDTPENRQRKAKYHERYDPFFAQRGYTPAQIERIMDLWVLQDTAREDVQAAVRQAGAAGDSLGVQELRANLAQPILRELREIMGEDGYAAYNRYQLTSMFRMGYVNRMQPVFASAGVAVSEAQTDQIVGVMTTSFGTERTDPSSLGSRLRVDWEAVARKSAVFLTPAQQSALASFIAQEKARGR